MTAEPDAPTLYRAHRKRTTTITLLVVIALLAAAFYYGYSYWVAGPRATACPTPTAAATTTNKNSSITVNVYNATARPGLAARTATSLKGYGFKIGKVSNDPLGRSVKASAEVRYGSKGAKAAKVVAGYIPGAKLVKDKRTNAQIDVAIGQAFTSLKAPTVKPTATATTSDGC